MRRVLFVDDDSNILDGLKRMLRSLRHEWEMSFALGPAQAEALIAQEPFDVVVTDMRMPGMNGAELLERVQAGHPHVVRIVLSGYSERELALRSAGIAHLFLAKPCDAVTLKTAVERSCQLRSLMTNENLARLVSGLGTLPSLPESYLQIRQELSSEEPSVKRVAAIVKSDVGMAAKILQLVNSAFFGLARRVDSLEQAVTLLGTEIIQSLVLGNAAFSQFQPRSGGLSLEKLWRHSQQVGAAARAIAKAEANDQAVQGQALQGGMLHDLGQLILATHVPEQFDQAVALANESRIPLHIAELEVLECTHAQVGAYLLGLWGLADSIVAALAYHHNPEQCPSDCFTPLVAVHSANALVHRISEGKDCPEANVNAEFLAAAGCAQKEDEWETLVMKTLDGTEMGV